MNKDAQYYITKLNLTTHPEGGFFVETYRCKNSIQNSEGNQRNISTAIFFLLNDNQKSHFHRIKSDELWFHHEGDAIEISVIVDGNLKMIDLGKDLENGAFLQATIPANCWFASQVKNKKGFALVSCTVAPGFDFNDFEMAKKDDLASQYPDFRIVIEDLCLD